MNTETDKTELAVAPKATVSSPISFGASGVQLTSLEDAFRFAKAIVSSGFAPRGMEKPESVLVALQWGAELGLTPMLALVRSSGQLESYSEEEVGERGKDSFGYKITAKRRGFDPQSETFTTSDAKTAKLWGKAGPWTDYPARMLKFRARGFLLRDVFGDVLKGLRTMEEVRDTPADPVNVTPRGLGDNL